MSTVSISYSSLIAASDEAGAVAKKLDKYADALENKVYKKLSKYDGEWSSNVSTALSKTDNKITELRDEQSRYEAYASDLKDLKDECIAVDKAVRSSVSALTASFKERNGIRNSKVENAISYFFTGLKNETAFGRWLDRKGDEYKAGTSYIKSCIKEWYNYEGGKEVVKGILVGVLEVAIAILSIAGAILSGGLLAVVGVVAGLIALANGIMNIYNETKAYAATQDGDPATGKRRSKINTCQDYLRSSYIFGDDGATYEYNEFYNGLALGIDIVNFVCTVITVVSSCGKLIKNGYKWATGDAAKIKDIKWSKIFSKETGVAIKGKFVDIGKAFKARRLSVLKDFGGQMLKDFGRNFKGEFLNFKEINGSLNWKGIVGSVKNMLGVTKDLVSDGFSISNICKVGFKSVVLPSLTAFTINSTNATLIDDGTGQMKLDFTDKVTINSIVGIPKSGWKVWKSFEGFALGETSIDIDLLNKLSTSCPVSIAIPEITVPNIEMPVLRVA